MTKEYIYFNSLSEKDELPGSEQQYLSKGFNQYFYTYPIKKPKQLAVQLFEL
ncbi:hypothetical protein B4064_2296 [Caldibacillus thermoamylovorans]|nr:hypothetical protein B4064_2296 [Caldibacillus thermoamylovorans]